MTGTADTSGPSAPVMTHVDEAAHREIRGHMHDPVDLGRLVHGAGPPGRVDEDGAVLADQAVAPGRRDLVLQLGALAESLESELGRHLVRQPGGVSPVLV